jgi:hypothetical protein
MTTVGKTDGFSWKQFFGFVASFGLVIALACGLAMVALGSGALERAVATHAPEAGRERVVIEWPGEGGKTWLPEAQRQELTALAKDVLHATGANPFDRGVISTLGTAFAKTGWFEGRPTVSRAGGGIIRLGGAWRTPAAVVRQRGEEQLIGWDGKPMPARFKVGLATFPVIDGITPPAPKTADGSVDCAQAWPGEEIIASLELLREIAVHPWMADVGGIDASEFGTLRSLAIVTKRGTRVVWGGRASKPSLGEVTSERKTAHIDELWKQTGRIDGGFQLVYINTQKLQVDISATAQATMAGAAAEVAAQRPDGLPAR